MSKLIITQIDKGRFKLLGHSILSSRQAMKFNIYLNSIPDISVEKNSDSIEITLKIIEEQLEAKIIANIITHLEKQNCELSIDNSIVKLLNIQSTHQQLVSSTLDILKAIKADSKEIKVQFEEFCYFCERILKIKLRGYQSKSAFLMSAGFGGFDFSVPGAGKTIITYAAYAYMKHNGIVDHIIVIGPGSSFDAWFDEYVTCFDELPEIENLAECTTKECKQYLRASAKNHKEISFINVEKVRLISSEIIQCISNSKMLLIVDEAHKIKNPDAAITKAVLNITKHAHARVILTGTPMPNGYEDLYSLTKTYSPFDEILPYNYIQLRNMTKNETTKTQLEKIRNSIEPYYSRISKKYLLETNELLPPQYQNIFCDMDDNQAELYTKLNEFCGKISDEIDEDILTSFKKAILIRKMQISANPGLLENSLIGSMDELREEYIDSTEKANSSIDFLIKADKNLMSEFANSTIVKTINRYNTGTLVTAKNYKAVDLAKKIVDNGQKVLIWDIFVKNMNVLKKLLEKSIDTTIELVNGSVVGTDRQLAIKRFREGDSMILIANPATLAESISLHKACQNAIYVNMNFNAAQYIQSKDRIHRINMPSGTTANYYFLFNRDTIDYTIDERLRLKEMRMLAILDADDIEVGGSEMEDSNIMSAQDIDNSFWR